MDRRYSIGGGGKSSYSNGFNDFNCCDFINFCHTFCKKAIAFTLAETLIVMGIIGVVAALTLPNLNSSTGDKEKVAKIKKIYSNLNDAMGRAIAVYGPYSAWKDGTLPGRLTEFMKISKDCGSTTIQSCFVVTNLKTASDKEDGILNPSSATIQESFISADSTGFIIVKSDNVSYVFIDVDGPNKGAHTISKDVFGFEIDNNTGEIIPRGQHLLSQGVNYLTCECFNDGNSACTAWVLQYDNMDYLKCPNKLSDTNTTCK